jgi:chromatin remodeling complex protein RSC6
MPRKPTQKSTEESQSSRRNNESDSSVQSESSSQVAVQKPARSRASRRNATSVPESVPEVSEQQSAVSAPKTRHVPTRETVEREFDELVASVDEEINKLRTSAGKSKGVKFLRTINKRIKSLKNHSLRVSRQRTTVRRNNTNSGFLKPVQISKDLAKFTGWDPAQLRSRVDVTKFICNYIKEHNLQDPQDKRNIHVDKDAGLKKLLRYDGKDGKPLTYYSLQTYLKSHFTPSPAVVSDSASVATNTAPQTPTPAATTTTASTSQPRRARAPAGQN